MTDSLSSPFASHLTLALLHFLWQGLLIGLLFRAALALTDARSTRIRYGLSLMALGVMAVCPVLTLVRLHVRADGRTAQVSSTDVQTAAPGNHPARRQPPAGILSFQNRHSPAQHGRTGVASARTAFAASQPSLLLMWLAGVVVASLRLTLGFAQTIRLRSGRVDAPDWLTRSTRQLARRIGLKHARICTSAQLRQAAVVGFYRPVVLLPASWLMTLPTDVLEVVIAHELAHVRRFDVWVNLLQRILETLLFYHPVVWWISNRARLEREMCCDDIAVQATGSPAACAIALEQVGRLQSEQILQLAPTFRGGGRMSLLNRVRHVLGTHRRPDREPAWLVGTLALSIPLAAAGIVTVATSWNAAMAQERERATETERRSPEADAEPRRSPEAEAGPRRSPEAEAGPRRSPEAEAEPRRSPEAEAGRRRSAEAGRESAGDRLIQDFEPQTEREAALYEMILQLQREIAALRGGDRPRDRDRGDRPESAGPRDREAEPELNREERRQERIFQSRDADGDAKLTPAEFASLFEGGDTSTRFRAADADGNGSLTLTEFIDYRLQPRPLRDEGAAPRGLRDRERAAPRGREREGAARDRE